MKKSQVVADEELRKVLVDEKCRILADEKCQIMWQMKMPGRGR